jgi:sugar transferase (PEP-CTERM system associated)
MFVRIFNAYFSTRTIFLVLSEAVVIALGFTISCVIWLGRDADIFLNYEGGSAKIALITCVFVICMYYLDLYDSLVLANRREIFVRFLLSAGFSTLVLGFLYSRYPNARLGLANFVLGLGIVIPFVLFWRELFIWLSRSKHLVERAILVGEGQLAGELAELIKNRPEFGLDLVGCVSAFPAQMDGNVPYLGTPDRLPELVQKQGVHRVIVTMADRRGKLPVQELLTIKSQYARVQDGTEIYEALSGKLPVESLRLSWLLFSPGFHISQKLLLYKRVFSLVFAGLLFILTFPIMLLAALVIRLDSPGPVIFRQKRIGKLGTIFILYKFRSMFDGADAGQDHKPATSDDDRVTRVGRWLRRTRLDELPQLYNILRGDMYFVGPRPFVPYQEEELAKVIPFYGQRWSVKPGATGWAQVNRGYCATVDDNLEKLAYDLFYIKNMSISLDLLILFKTIKTLILSRGGR